MGETHLVFLEVKILIITYPSAIRSIGTPTYTSAQFKAVIALAT